MSDTKKLFVSIPMNGLSRDEILKEMTAYKELAEGALMQPLELIPPLEDTGKNALECLGKSIQRMATADVVYFGDGWRHARGCIFEHQVAETYGIPELMLESEDE